jgi:hypothetical protein
MSAQQVLALPSPAASNTVVARLTPHRVMLEIIARSQALRMDGADGGPKKASPLSPG